MWRGTFPTCTTSSAVPSHSRRVCPSSSSSCSTRRRWVVRVCPRHCAVATASRCPSATRPTVWRICSPTPPVNPASLWRLLWWVWTSSVRATTNTSRLRSVGRGAWLWRGARSVALRCVRSWCPVPSSSPTGSRRLRCVPWSVSPWRRMAPRAIRCSSALTPRRRCGGLEGPAHGGPVCPFPSANPRPVWFPWRPWWPTFLRGTAWRPVRLLSAGLLPIVPAPRRLPLWRPPPLLVLMRRVLLFLPRPPRCGVPAVICPALRRSAPSSSRFCECRGCPLCWLVVRSSAAPPALAGRAPRPRVAVYAASGPPPALVCAVVVDRSRFRPAEPCGALRFRRRVAALSLCRCSLAAPRN